jgi:hypothetical protein
MNIFSNLKRGYNSLFAERDRQGNWMFFPNELNGFMDNRDYLKQAINNPVLLSIIALRSRIYSQMQITHVKANGEEISNSPYVKLLKKPNYFQSQEDFLFQEMFFKSATGTNLTYQINALNKPEALYNLIPNCIDYNETEKLKTFITTKRDFEAYGKKKIIYKLDGQNYNIEIDSLIPSYDLANGLVENSFMRSPSRLQGLSRTIQNIEENLKSKNVNLQMTQKYLVSSAGDGNAAHIQDADRKDLKQKIGMQSVMISNIKMDAKHLVSDMKRLYLDEQMSNDALACIIAFGMNRDVINYFSNGASTYENSEKGMQNYIQNGIQTEADDRMNSLSLQWGLFENGEKLVASYEHLPVMQSIVKTKIDTLKSFEETLKIGIENGTIILSEAIEMSKNLRIKLKL